MAEILSFYDVGAKKRFKTGNYEVKVKKGQRTAFADSPLTGNKVPRFLGKA